MLSETPAFYFITKHGVVVGIAWSLESWEWIGEKCPLDSVFSPSPRSAAGGSWSSTGRQTGSRSSCNKNKHISCLYSMTTGGHTHSCRHRKGASPVTTSRSPGPTMSLPTECERYHSPASSPVSRRQGSCKVLVLDVPAAEDLPSLGFQLKNRFWEVRDWLAGFLKPSSECSL